MISIVNQPAGTPAAATKRFMRLLALALTALVLLLTALLHPTPAMAAAPATQRVEACSWDHPGVNPYMGDMASAVERYTDIPLAVRDRLRQRMAKRQYDEIAVIKRDSIEGQADYDPILRDMHFGTNRVCANVSRKAWSSAQQERGLVYCEGDQCLIVPTVCRNVSRITRKSAAVAGAPPITSAGLPPESDLLFPAPAAGPLVPDGGPIGNAPFAAGAAGALGPGPVIQSLSAPSFAALASGGGGSGDISPSAGAAPLFPTPAIDAPSSPEGAPAPPFFFTGPPVLGQVPSGNAPPILAVPEPSTWTLMLAGLIGVGAFARRRRRVNLSCSGAPAAPSSASA